MFSVASNDSIDIARHDNKDDSLRVSVTCLLEDTCTLASSHLTFDCMISVLDTDDPVPLAVFSFPTDDFVSIALSTSTTLPLDTSCVGVTERLLLRIPDRRVTCGLCDSERSGDGEYLRLDDDACWTGLSDLPTATDGLAQRLEARVMIGDVDGREWPGDVTRVDVDRVERSARDDGCGKPCCMEWERRGLRDNDRGLRDSGGVSGRFDTRVGRGGV